MNYAEIKLALQAWLHDTSSEFVGLADTVIRFGETRLNRDLNTPKMIATVTGSIAATVSLPSNFQEIISLSRVDSSACYTPIDAMSFSAIRNGGIGYCITASGLMMSPMLSGTYELAYKTKLLSIVENSTNIISTNHPDLYLYAAMLEGAAFLRDEKINEIQMRYDELLQSVNMNEQRIGQRPHMTTDFIAP